MNWSRAQAKVRELASNLGCKVGSFPTSCLGLPLGVSCRSKAIWDPMIEKFEKRWAAWKRGYLSKGDKMMLIRNTLASLPTYCMSLFWITAYVGSRLEKFQRYIYILGRARG